MPSIPGSGTAVPPDVDDVVLVLVLPDEVVPPPDEVDEVVVPPPDELEVVDDVVELEVEELVPFEPPELHQGKPRASAGLAMAMAISTLAMVAIRFMWILLLFWPALNWLTPFNALTVPIQGNPRSRWLTALPERGIDKISRQFSIKRD